MTPYQLHVQKWKNGCGSCLCDKVRRRVMCRGTLPAPILFVGEAPGTSENDYGQPFVGPAGHLLDDIIRRAWEGKYDGQYAMTNLVSCFPVEEKKTGNHEPPDSAIKACRPRLLEFIRLCQPRVIVCVGALARKWIPTQSEISLYPDMSDSMGRVPWLGQNEFIDYIDIHHPAGILRAPEAKQGLMIKSCIARLQGVEL